MRFHRLATFVLILAVVLLTGSRLIPAQAPASVSARPLEVDFLDVGQGDAIFVKSPSGKRVLIDGGPPEAAERLAKRMERERSPMDLVLLTHRHADHLGGLARILAHPGARMFMDSRFEHPTPLFAPLLRILEARNVPVRDAAAGRTIDLGEGAVMTLLGPPTPFILGTRSDANANSVVARLDFRRASVLLCADAEAETERWLLKQGRTLQAQVVKVPHHGNRYSSTPAFVRAVSPKWAVVTVGIHNSYRHPDERTLARWARVGARILRTDLDGEIQMKSDGQNIFFTAERGGTVPALQTGR